jgi:hypothetical protein
MLADLLSSVIKRNITVKRNIKMKKRKLNSKNPKYKTEAELKATVQEADKRILIAEAKRCKVYAAFYK